MGNPHHTCGNIGGLKLACAGALRENDLQYFESTTDDDESASDYSEEEPKSSSMRRTTQSEKAAKLASFDFAKLQTQRGTTSFVRQIGRNLAQMAINSSYDRLKSVNFLIAGPTGSNDRNGNKRPATKGDPSTDPRLRTVFNRLDMDGNGQITAKNIDAIFAYLKHVPLSTTIYGISEAEYLIWESDDSLAGYLDFETFVTKIAICDSSSRRSCPRRLYDLFVFLALDKDGDGTVDTDELMELILKKYGRARLDELFGSLETGANQAGCTLTYTEFTGNVALNLASLHSRSSTSAMDEHICSFFITVKAFLMGPQGKGRDARLIPMNGLNIDFKEKLTITSLFSQFHTEKKP